MAEVEKCPAQHVHKVEFMRDNKHLCEIIQKSMTWLLEEANANNALLLLLFYLLLLLSSLLLYFFRDLPKPKQHGSILFWSEFINRNPPTPPLLFPERKNHGFWKGGS